MYFITVSSIVILVMALVFAEPIVGIFSGRDSRTYEIAADGFFLFSFNYIFAGINIFASAMFTAFGDGKRSAIISFCRTFIFIVVSILVLPLVMGVTGVWLSVPLAEFVTLSYLSATLKVSTKNTIMHRKRRVSPSFSTLSYKNQRSH
mgnify:CR=1 FL=1